jgi:hypothetical protein
MKTACSLALFVLFTITTTAQQADYNGVAKSYVNSFWTKSKTTRDFIGKGLLISIPSRIAGMEKNVDDIISKDPGYNKTMLEEEIKNIRKLYESKSKELVEKEKKQEEDIQLQQEKRRMQSGNQVQVDRKLESLFGRQLVLSAGGNSGLKTIRQVIEDYKKGMEALLAMDKSNNSESLERYKKYLQHDYESTTADFAELERRCREQTKGEHAEVYYYELVYKQAYWDAAQKLYPGETAFAAACSLATKTIARLGSISDLHANASKNIVQKINDTRMPAAIVKDVALEKLFTEAFNKRYREEFKGTAIKAVILTPDWGIERNQLTGIIIGRVRRGAVAYKGNDGKCYLCSQFSIYQDYVSGSFQGTRAVYVVYAGQEMLCANVE